jgi:hypothetical protein
MEQNNNNNNNNNNRKKLYILFPLEFFKNKIKNKNVWDYIPSQINLISNLLIILLGLLYILNILNFITYNYNNNFYKLIHLCSILFITALYSNIFYNSIIN